MTASSSSNAGTSRPTNRTLERYDLCFDTVLHCKCLVKTLTKTQLKPLYRNKNIMTHRLLQNQVAILKKITHKNLVKLNEVIMDSNTDKLFLVSSYSPSTSLQGVLSRVGRIEEAKAREYFRQILEVLYYCYTVGGVIHRNITLENILILDANDCPQLMEMGQAFLVENEDSDTPEEYIAPELKDKSKYKSAQTDVWALGVCLYCMTEGCFPFTSFTAELTHSTLQKQGLQFRHAGKDLQELLEGMLARDPSRRIKLKQINVNVVMTVDAQLGYGQRNGAIGRSKERVHSGHRG